VTDVVEHGSKAVEEIHKATAARTFFVLEAVPPISKPAKVVHVVHDAWLSGVYGAIRVVNGVVGKTLDVAMDVADAREAGEEPAEASAEASRGAAGASAARQ
jgi:hypothetical protein